MKYESAKKLFLIIFPVIVLIFIDQFSKYIIRLRQLADGGLYICNKNIAFGIPIPDFLFWVFWIVIIILLSVALYKKYFIYNTLSMILIFAGAISNMFDRLFFGCVIDFIDLKFWPVFNLADVFITIGAIMLMYSLAFKKPLTK